MTRSDLDPSQLLAYDPVRRRPACVLLAGALGGNPEFAAHFDCRLWIVDNPEGIRLYGPLTDEEVRKIAEQLEAEIAAGSVA